MRVLIFICVCAFSAFAQTAFVSQTFEAANETARKGRYEQAVEQYRATILRAENEHLSDVFLARIHFNSGVCFYQLNRNEEAVAEFTEAIKLSRREYQPAFYALGMAQKNLKKWCAAESALLNAVRLNESDGEAWFDLALIYLEEKELTAAGRAFRKAVKYESVNAADAHNNLGVIAALKNDWTFAEREFETALAYSNNKSNEAAGNLQFCKFYKQNFGGADLLAKLEFSRY